MQQMSCIGGVSRRQGDSRSCCSIPSARRKGLAMGERTAQLSARAIDVGDRVHIRQGSKPLHPELVGRAGTVVEVFRVPQDSCLVRIDGDRDRPREWFFIAMRSRPATRQKNLIQRRQQRFDTPHGTQQHIRRTSSALVLVCEVPTRLCNWDTSPGPFYRGRTSSTSGYVDTVSLCRL